MEPVKNLEYIGPTTLDEANGLLVAASINVLTSISEGFPNGTIQGWLRETSTITTIDKDQVIMRQKIGFHVSSIDMMEDDHVKTLQLATIVFNFLGMAMRLPDENSRLIMLDAAVEQGKAFIELMRLHIFREETITFSQAMEHLTVEELDGM